MTIGSTGSNRFHIGSEPISRIGSHPLGDGTGTERVEPTSTAGTDPCGDCEAVRPIMVAMVPGVDRQPWSLCRRCWVATAIIPTTAEPITAQVERPIATTAVLPGMEARR